MTHVTLEDLAQIAQELKPHAFTGLDNIGEQDLVALGFDSLALMQLFGNVEQRFDIDIFGMVGSPDDYRTLQGLLQLCLGAQQAALPA